MPEPITSLQNRRVKDAVRLRDRRGRDAQGRFIIDGVREISRAMDAGVEIVELFLCREMLSDACHTVWQRAADAGAPIFEVTPRIHAKLAYGEREEALLAVARRTPLPLDALQLPACPLVAVLESVEKPGNVGAVIRTADATGVSAVILADAATDLFNPNTIRASLGTVFTLPCATATAAEARAWLAENQIAIFAARVDARLCYTQAGLAQPAALVLGSEAKGLSAVWQGDDVTPISLPLLGSADSLNVSVTAAVLMYEALRQRAAR